MARIGNLGKLIIFEVSSEKVLTFHGLTQTVKGRWTTHNVISRKPVSEFLGSDIRRIQIPITLHVNHGVRPRSTIEKIEKSVENGTPHTLVIGGKRIGSNQFRITEMTETWGEVIMDGKLVSAKLTLTLEEYV